MNWLDYFDQVYVINLPKRLDRRRDMERELHRPDVGIDAGSAHKISFFPAIAPEAPAPFNSVGVKGCFLSHLAVIENATERGFSNILVLEDDAEFVRPFAGKMSAIVSSLQRLEWGLVQLGYSGGPSPTGSEVRLLEFSGEVTGGHCYALNRSAMARLAAQMKRQYRGVPGDDLHGPMPFDGCLNVFKWLNPDLPRYLAVPSLARQRSSRSDITPGRLDKVRLLAPLFDAARRLRARL